MQKPTNREVRLEMRYIMSGRFYIEKRVLRGGKSLSWDLAQHMSTRHTLNTVVIVEHPGILLASVSKQWQKIVRHVRRARSGTLDATLIYELTQQLSDIQRIRMIAGPGEADDGHSIRIYFLTLDQALAQPPTCQTLYCTVPVTAEDFEAVTAKLPQGALVVEYG